MTKTTARHRAPLTARGRLTRIWSAMSALPVGALAGCAAVGAAAGTGTPAVGALGLVALAPATVAGWRARLVEDTGHGRRAAQRPRRDRSLRAQQPTVRLAALLEPATTGPRARSLPPLATAPRLVRPAQLGPAARFAPPRPMLALGTAPAAARTPIVLDVPDLAALQLATGQDAVWHGRTARAEQDPSRLFTVSSSSGTVEVVVLTRAERAARDLDVLAALEATTRGDERADAGARADVADLAARARHAAGQQRGREDDGLASAA